MGKILRHVMIRVEKLLLLSLMRNYWLLVIDCHAAYSLL